MSEPNSIEKDKNNIIKQKNENNFIKEYNKTNNQLLDYKNKSIVSSNSNIEDNLILSPQIFKSEEMNKEKKFLLAILFIT